MNSELPLVSVLMSTYNSETTLERAINSILNQSYKRIEFLICNDGSTDNTKKILDKYPDWIAKVIGDEKREKILLSHKNAHLLGFRKHEDCLLYTSPSPRDRG